jgi:hypothetical protein
MTEARGLSGAGRFSFVSHWKYNIIGFGERAQYQRRSPRLSYDGYR